MSAGVRVRAEDARLVADEVVRLLAYGCERIEVAGSLRRGRRDVADIELLAIPKMHTEPSGLFFDVDAVVSDLDDAVADLIESGTVTRLLGKDRYQKLRHVESGLQIDLFIVRPPAQWGVLFLIRTGPADYSQRFVTDIRHHGFHVREGSLHRGGVLGCGSVPCEIVDTPEERDVYAAVGQPWVAPEFRL